MLEPNAAYKKIINKEFREKYLQYDVTEQRVTNQKRAIEKKGLVSESDLQQLRERIGMENDNRSNNTTGLHLIQIL